MPVTPDPLTESDVLDMLHRHYAPPNNKPPGVMFLPEVQSPDGRRRADLITAGVTTRNRKITGHEIKVTRQDLLVELRDPTKHDPWSRFCDRWYLVVADPAMIEGLDLPEWWGVMSPPSGRRTRTMTILRPAPDLKPADPGAAWQRIAITNWNRQRAELSSAERTNRNREYEIQNLKNQIAQIKDASGTEVGPWTDSQVRKLLDALVDRVDEPSKHAALSWPDMDALADYLVDHRQAADTIRRMGLELRFAVRDVRDAVNHAQTLTEHAAALEEIKAKYAPDQ